MKYEESFMISKKLQNFIDPIIHHCESQFPKKCPCCQKVFLTFKEFVSSTKTIGVAPTDCGIPENENPFGILSFVNCVCGSTITIRCEDKTGEMHKLFTEAVTSEAKEFNLPEATVLEELRSLIRAKANKKD